MDLYKVKMQLDYSWGTPEEREAAKVKNVERLVVAANLCPDVKFPADYPGDENVEVIVTSDNAMKLATSGFCGTGYFNFSEHFQRVDIALPDENIVENLVSTMTEKFAEALARSSDLRMNERCRQEQPGLGLTSITETLLMEDACTDVLQDALANGWRIIAVQPQPDQRRPDYILGRAHGLPTSAGRA